MFCRRCGNKLNDGDLFCSKCGSKVENDIEEVVFPEPVVDVVEETTPVVEETTTVVEESTNEAKEPRGPWKSFAKVGHILGVVSLATMWIPFFVCCSIGFYGIVFSALGKKSASSKPIADKALNRNIAASIVSFVLTIVIYSIILFALAY